MDDFIYVCNIMKADEQNKMKLKWGLGRVLETKTVGCMNTWQL